MDKRSYDSFCNKYEIDPTDYEAVLETVDGLEGMFGDTDGKLQQIREYILNNKVDLSTKEDTVDKSVVGLLEPNVVTVYQMVDGDSTYGKRFMSYDFVKNHGGVNMEDYEKVAEVPVEDNVDVNVVLEDVFRYGNTNPEYYANNPKARSISVSDILEYKLVKYYVDSMGFVNLDKETTLTEAKDTTPSMLRNNIIKIAKDLGLTVDHSGKDWVVKDGDTDVLYLTPRRAKNNYMDRLKIYTVENPSEKAKELYNTLKAKGLLEEDKELLAEEGEDEPPFIEKDDEEIPVEDLPETNVDNVEDEDKTLLDYLQDRIGQQMSVAELNTVLQSFFSRYNDIFILESDIYNADLDETQELIINDDMEDYIINYDIIDVEAGIIEITDVNVE